MSVLRLGMRFYEHITSVQNCCRSNTLEPESHYRECYWKIWGWIQWTKPMWSATYYITLWYEHPSHDMTKKNTSFDSRQGLCLTSGILEVWKITQHQGEPKRLSLTHEFDSSCFLQACNHAHMLGNSSSQNVNVYFQANQSTVYPCCSWNTPVFYFKGNSHQIVWHPVTDTYCLILGNVESPILRWIELSDSDPFTGGCLLHLKESTFMWY